MMATMLHRLLCLSFVLTLSAPALAQPKPKEPDGGKGGCSCDDPDPKDQDDGVWAFTPAGLVFLFVARRRGSHTSSP